VALAAVLVLAAGVGSALGCRACFRSETAPEGVLEPVRRLKLAGDSPVAATIEDEGGTLLVAGMYGPVQVWALSRTEGEPVGTWKASEQLRAVHLAGRETILIAADGGVVTLWNWKTGQTLFSMNVPEPVERAAMSRDGRFVASGGTVFDRQAGRLVDPPMPVTGQKALEFSADGHKLLSAGFHDQWIIVRDLATQKVDKWSAPGKVTAGALAAGGDAVVAALRGGRIQVYRPGAGDAVASWSHGEEVQALHFAPGLYT
jgi:hypothetical protein